MSDLSLSERVVAPPVAELPTFDGLSWRAASADDIDAVTELAQAADRVDHPHYLTTREEIEEEFESSHVDADRDMIVGIAPSGELVAYGQSRLSPGQDTLVRCFLVGFVHPDWRGRGIGRQVLAWQEQRALQQLASSDKTLPGWTMAFAEDTGGPSQRMLARAGFEPARYYLELHRDLGQPMSVVPHPAGVELRAYQQADSAAVRLARNDAFRDHWGSQPTLEEQWEYFTGKSTFRADLSFVAIADGEVVGFVMTEVNEADWEGQGFSSGYIDLVGVTRGWRRRGIAPALLALTLEACLAAGLDRAVLDVDSESPTGALSLYEGVGFTTSARSINFVKVY